jgi:hypothetical protein
MKFIISSLLILILGYAFGLYLPWWSVALAGCIVGALLGMRPLQSFLSGFLAVFLLWGALTYFRSLANTHILAQRFASLMLGSEDPRSLIAVTAFIGGTVTGLGALCGSFFRRLITRPETI